MKCSVPVHQESKTNWSADICSLMALLHGVWSPAVHGMEIHPCKHTNNMHKMFILIKGRYKFPVVLCCIFLLLLLLFKDICSAAPLSNLGLFQTDVFEVLCLCSIEWVQEISGDFFFPFLHEQP